MAGIYLHIPFCKQACHYCNFHFSTSLRLKKNLLSALKKEVMGRQGYLDPHAPIESIYLGGGTPSLLTEAELADLFELLFDTFRVAPDAEITLEANPDDLSPQKVAALRRSPVNRLSIGLQSFSDEDLHFFNRAHTAAESHACLERVLAAGFEDLTVDLIYGAPTTSDARWKANVEAVLTHGIRHLSCYALTVEPRTALAYQIEKGRTPPPDEEQVARQFEWLVERMEQAGYEHYEISNFARPGHRARHNSNYWLGRPYLGLGPSAHSFDGLSRQWNLANNARYIRALESGRPWDQLEGVVWEREMLGADQRYNEYVLTRLRTAWGCAQGELEQLGTRYWQHFHTEALPFLRRGQITEQEGIYRLSRAGMLLADHIAAALFFPEIEEAQQPSA